MLTSGLLFNSPENAALVTRKGREILQTAIDWAEEKGYTIPNVDTDSISYVKPDNSPISDEQFRFDLDEINSLYPEKIIWEDDGGYDAFVVVKAKNYIMKNGDKVKFKGSGLTDQKKEKAAK